MRKLARSRDMTAMTPEGVMWSLKLFGIDDEFKKMSPALKLVSVFRRDEMLFRDLVSFGIGDCRIPWMRELAALAEHVRMFNHGLQLKARDKAHELKNVDCRPRTVSVSG